MANVPPERQRLIYRAQALQDGQKVNEKIKDNDQTIHLIIKAEEPQPSTQGPSAHAHSASGPSNNQGATTHPVQQGNIQINPAGPMPPWVQNIFQSLGNIPGVVGAGGQPGVPMQMQFVHGTINQPPGGQPFIQVARHPTGPGGPSPAVHQQRSPNGQQEHINIHHHAQNHPHVAQNIPPGQHVRIVQRPNGQRIMILPQPNVPGGQVNPQMAPNTTTASVSNPAGHPGSIPASNTIIRPGVSATRAHTEPSTHSTHAAHSSHSTNASVLPQLPVNTLHDIGELIARSYGSRVAFPGPVMPPSGLPSNSITTLGVYLNNLSFQITRFLPLMSRASALMSREPTMTGASDRREAEELIQQTAQILFLIEQGITPLHGMLDQVHLGAAPGGFSIGHTQNPASSVYSHSMAEEHRPNPISHPVATTNTGTRPAESTRMEEERPPSQEENKSQEPRPVSSSTGATRPSSEGPRINQEHLMMMMNNPAFTQVKLKDLAVNAIQDKKEIDESILIEVLGSLPVGSVMAVMMGQIEAITERRLEIKEGIRQAMEARRLTCNFLKETLCDFFVSESI